MGSRQVLLEGPLAILLNGQGAVQLFFVLSGYVLTSSLSRNKHWSNLIQFYIRRFLRIYPPYIAAVLFALLASHFYASMSGDHGLTWWILKTLKVQPTLQEVLPTFLFPSRALGLVPPGWTLKIEMIYSLLMPLMLLIARRVHWQVLILLCLSALLLPNGSPRAPLYSIDFGLGIALFLERERLARWIGRIPQLLTPVVVAVGLYLLSAPLLLGWMYPSRSWGIMVSGYDPKSILTMGIGSAILVAMTVHMPWLARALSVRPIEFLGKLSFSIYLLHHTILTMFATLLRPQTSRLDGFILLSLVLLATIPASALCYYAVERPSIALGNRLCRLLAPRTSSSASQISRSS